MARSILLITNREHGAANVHLAVLFELIQHPNLALHIASFPQLKPHVLELSRHAASISPVASSVTFHELDGPYYSESVANQGGAPFTELATHAAGIRASLKAYRFLPRMMEGWTVQEHLRLYSRLSSLIEKVDPAVIILDPVFQPAGEATRDSGRKYVVLSPNSLKDAVGSVQPRLASLWKYPIFASGLPFPLPLHLIPMNIFLFVYLIYCILTDSKLKAKNAALKLSGHPHTPALLDAASFPAVPWLAPSIVEIDFPVIHIPKNVVSCGPIIMDWSNVARDDPDLSRWLAQRPTILVNLGTLFNWDTEKATAMARAIQLLLDKVPNMQVLWKAKLGSQSSVLDLLDTYLSKDQVRIVDWLHSQPGAIARHENIVAVVHHGGASSYNETISAGKPHVILAMWFDLYDFATKVEYLGVGVWGNKTMAPAWSAEEVGAALLKVVCEGDSMKDKASRLAQLCQTTGCGRKIARDTILSYAEEESKIGDDCVVKS